MAARNTANKKKAQTGQLRIVAGIWRSRLLQIATVAGLRPTSERIRETLFNWLAPRIQGAKCLDLCAGTGALGIEALSRGASELVFIEQSAVATGALQINLAALEAHDTTVLNVDARKYLQRFDAAPFDIVFLDPPFAAELRGELCRLLDENGWLAQDARIYIEMDRRRPGVRLPQGWTVLKDKTAGNVRYVLATTEV